MKVLTKHVYSFYGEEAQLSFFEEERPRKENSPNNERKTCTRENKRVRYFRYDANAGDEYAVRTSKKIKS